MYCSKVFALMIIITMIGVMIMLMMNLVMISICVDAHHHQDDDEDDLDSESHDGSNGDDDFGSSTSSFLNHHQHRYYSPYSQEYRKPVQLANPIVICTCWWPSDGPLPSRFLLYGIGWRSRFLG